MKKVIVMLCVFLFLGLTSCISSLHGIVTDSTIILDDRLIGSWDLAVYNYRSIDQSDAKKTVAGQKLKREKFYTEDEKSIWSFERAAKISFENPLTKTYMSMSVGSPSMAPPGMIIHEKEDLPFYLLTHKNVSYGDTIITRLIAKLTVIDDDHYMDFYPKELSSKETQGIFAANFLYGHSFAKITFLDERLSIQSFEGDFIKDLIRRKRIRLKNESVENGDIVLTASTEELRNFIAKYGDDINLFQEEELLTKLAL